MSRAQQPAKYAWQAAHLLATRAPRKKVEKALRNTLLFWACFDNIPVPPLLRCFDVQAFEHLFWPRLQRLPRKDGHGANAAALEAVRELAVSLGWEPF